MSALKYLKKFEKIMGRDAYISVLDVNDIISKLGIAEGRDKTPTEISIREGITRMLAKDNVITVDEFEDAIKQIVRIEKEEESKKPIDDPSGELFTAMARLDSERAMIVDE